MRVIQTSDTHWGITNPGSIRKMFRRIAEREEFDLLVHCGDYCGTDEGAPCVRKTLEVIRDYLPDIPIVSVLGNHDYWTPRPSWEGFQNNYRRIREAVEEFSIHFLDEDGPLLIEDWTVVGHTGWYYSPNPPTNDFQYLPAGMTHSGIFNRASAELGRTLDLLGEADTTESTGNRLLFVSHFPVVNPHPEFGGGSAIGDLLATTYGCRYLLCGHAHQLHRGPLRWESGSDYYRPAYQLIPLENGGIADEPTR